MNGITWTIEDEEVRGNNPGCQLRIMAEFSENVSDQALELLQDEINDLMETRIKPLVVGKKAKTRILKN